MRDRTYAPRRPLLERQSLLQGRVEGTLAPWMRALFVNVTSRNIAYLTYDKSLNGYRISAISSAASISAWQVPSGRPRRSSTVRRRLVTVWRLTPRAEAAEAALRPAAK